MMGDLPVMNPQHNSASQVIHVDFKKNEEED